MMLPETQQAIIYHPFENERFMKMVYIEPPYLYLGKHYDYNAYKDLDPEYYEQENCVLFE